MACSMQDDPDGTYVLSLQFGNTFIAQTFEMTQCEYSCIPLRQDTQSLSQYFRLLALSGG